MLVPSEFVSSLYVHLRLLSGLFVTNIWSVQTVSNVALYQTPSRSQWSRRILPGSCPNIAVVFRVPKSFRNTHCMVWNMNIRSEMKILKSSVQSKTLSYKIDREVWKKERMRKNVWIQDFKYGFRIWIWNIKRILTALNW